MNADRLHEIYQTQRKAALKVIPGRLVLWLESCQGRRHNSRSGISLSGNYAWDYRFVDTWGYTAIFSVTFDRTGIVVSKISQRIERDKSH